MMYETQCNLERTLEIINFVFVPLANTSQCQHLLEHPGLAAMSTYGQILLDMRMRSRSRPGLIYISFTYHLRLNNSI